MPSIKFDMSDVQPFASALGLGQAPAKTAPPVNQLPVPPMPPPPPPAAAGFTEWASDPRTAKKINDGIVLPGTPLLSSRPFTPTLGVGMPPSPNTPNIMPPQRDTSFIAPPGWQRPQAQSPASVDPRLAPAATLTPPSLLPASGSLPTNLPPAPTTLQPSNATSLYGGQTGDQSATTATQRAFPSPVSAASGLHDKNGRIQAGQPAVYAWPFPCASGCAISKSMD
jgi:hypothetical protein